MLNKDYSGRKAEMLTKFFKFIDSLPLAGKLAIRPSAFALYNSRTPNERLSWYLLLAIILVSLVLLHGVQARTGIESLFFHSPVWAKAISAVYAFVNVAVSATQIRLLCRATRFFLRAPYPKRWRQNDGSFTGQEALTMLVVTVIGQLAFIVPHNWYS